MKGPARARREIPLSRVKEHFPQFATLEQPPYLRELFRFEEERRREQSLPTFEEEHRPVADFMIRLHSAVAKLTQFDWYAEPRTWRASLPGPGNVATQLGIGPDELATEASRLGVDLRTVLWQPWYEAVRSAISRAEQHGWTRGAGPVLNELGVSADAFLTDVRILGADFSKLGVDATTYSVWEPVTQPKLGQIHVENRPPPQLLEKYIADTLRAWGTMELQERFGAAMVLTAYGVSVPDENIHLQIAAHIRALVNNNVSRQNQRTTIEMLAQHFHVGADMLIAWAEQVGFHSLTTLPPR